MSTTSDAQEGAAGEGRRSRAIVEPLKVANDIINKLTGSSEPMRDYIMRTVTGHFEVVKEEERIARGETSAPDAGEPLDFLVGGQAGEAPASDPGRPS